MKRKIIGFTAGTWDLVHPGHLLAFKEIRSQCDKLIVAIQPNPNIDQPEKAVPVETMEERMIRLEACKYIDEIVTYQDQKDLEKLINDLYSIGRINVRFVGADHKGKRFTGDTIPIKLIFNSRDHNYSSTNLRNRLKNSK